jgi:hypothetical protein
MSAGELLALLRSDISMDDVPQSGCVDDTMLAQLLDRSWMLTAEERQQQQQSEAASAGSSDAEASEGGNKSSKAAKGKGGRRASRSTTPAAAESAGAAASAGSSGQGQQDVAGLPYPASGVGYEVVQAIGDSGLLSNVN